MEIPSVEKKQNLASSSRTLIKFGIDEELGCHLQPGYMQPSMEIDKISRFWVTDCRRSLSFHESSADDKYDHVDLLLRAFFMSEKHRANLFLSKKFVLFLRDMIWVYSVAAAVNEQRLTTDDKNVSCRVLEPWVELLALIYFAERRTVVVRKDFIIFK